MNLSKLYNDKNVLQDIKIQKIKVKQVHGTECNIVFLVVIPIFRSFSIFFKIKKVQHKKSAIWKECNREIVEAYTGPPQTSKMERFATTVNSFVNYCCKALHLRCLWGSWLLGNSAAITKCNIEKIATCEKCNRRRMQNGNIATCKSAT